MREYCELIIENLGPNSEKIVEVDMSEKVQLKHLFIMIPGMEECANVS